MTRIVSILRSTPDCHISPHKSKLTLSSAREADEWLDKLKLEVHPLIKREMVGSGTQVRIAILDTGLELPEDCQCIYSDRIRECRSWLDAFGLEDGNPETGNIDVDGHGTHSTGLLLEVAPNAEIFVARVFESRGEKQGKQATEATQVRVSQVSVSSPDLWSDH